MFKNHIFLSLFESIFKWIEYNIFENDLRCDFWTFFRNNCKFGFPMAILVWFYTLYGISTEESKKDKSGYQKIKKNWKFDFLRFFYVHCSF